MNGTIDFSLEARCWIWRCAWGCSAIDFESEAEAMEDFVAHRCEMSC